MRELSLSLVEKRIDELKLDLAEFRKAYYVLVDRIHASRESRAYPLLETWSGSRAVVGSLELAINEISRNLDEHLSAKQMIVSGEIRNSDDSPTQNLKVVK